MCEHNASFEFESNLSTDIEYMFMYDEKWVDMNDLF